MSTVDLEVALEGSADLDQCLGQAQCQEHVRLTLCNMFPQGLKHLLRWRA